MGSRSATLHEQFRERRANFSTRVSGRGHGYEFAEYDGLHKGVLAQIPDWIAALRRAESEVPFTHEADCQVKRLRGRLGNMRAILGQNRKYGTESIFMNAAREMLPADIFDAIMEEVRLQRTGIHGDLLKRIDEALIPLADVRRAAGK